MPDFTVINTLGRHRYVPNKAIISSKPASQGKIKGPSKEINSKTMANQWHQAAKPAATLPNVPNRKPKAKPQATAITHPKPKKIAAPAVPAKVTARLPVQSTYQTLNCLLKNLN